MYENDGLGRLEVILPSKSQVQVFILSGLLTVDKSAKLTTLYKQPSSELKSASGTGYAVTVVR